MQSRDLRIALYSTSYINHQRRILTTHFPTRTIAASRRVTLPKYKMASAAAQPISSDSLLGGPCGNSEDNRLEKASILKLVNRLAESQSPYVRPQHRANKLLHLVQWADRWLGVP